MPAALASRASYTMVVVAQRAIDEFVGAIHDELHRFLADLQIRGPTDSAHIRGS